MPHGALYDTAFDENIDDNKEECANCIFVINAAYKNLTPHMATRALDAPRNSIAMLAVDGGLSADGVWGVGILSRTDERTRPVGGFTNGDDFRAGTGSPCPATTEALGLLPS